MRADEHGASRAALVEQVRARCGGTLAPPVAEALRAVPRHLFLPGTPPADAYRDEAIVTKRDADGRPISSSSQPTIMAMMLGQLGVAPGHRVLEIGAGTGYNAALMSYLAGPAGAVVSIDIDADLVEAARARLHAAGHSGVRVVHADGAAGFAPGAPYDRVIATVGVWDLEPAWFDQLAPGGRIVVPLDLRGVQRSVALERAGAYGWTAVSIIPCGFMRMRGPAAGPERTHVLDREAGLVLESPAGQDTAAGPLAAALAAGPVVERPTGVAVAAPEVSDGLSLWLALHEPRWCTLSGPAARLGAAPLNVQGFGMAPGLLGPRGLALLARPGGAPDAGDLVVAGFGPDGGELAADLAARVRDWAAAGRPGTAGLRLEVRRGRDASDPPPGAGVIPKVHTWLVLSRRPPR
ncbi:hypothetical protein Sru01_59080 [Sphaerisporangium rufum]|uniref:Protein-L-isoaspartate O-methyltransferase n=1 Tax=Sphaerisporangium rufum TaxID=1381558 RepID=A0A919R9J1_9ACTN|nr:methyltransferase, FxLD system [Sphaerisporangium rufum]GII80926.1 hypothetical protein Sru01_59080 [Sphaerisporangium rufum]